MANEFKNDNQPNIEARLAKMASDLEVVKRRTTMALNCAKEALKYSLCTPRTARIIKEIEEELKR
jgi:hypothetical protein